MTILFQRFRHLISHPFFRMFLLSITIGILSGVTARGVEFGVQWAYASLVGPFATPGRFGTFGFQWPILAMTLGAGALSGLVMGILCKPAEALATEAYVRAFHVQAGYLSIRDSILKACASIGVIGLGGSMGKEGPIAVLAASIGSTVSGSFKITSRERRLFLVTGCAAGVGAIFQCPLGGALFATTVLYREPEIEADALMPSIIASVVSYSTFMAFGGYGVHMLPGTDALKFTQPIELLGYAVLGLFCALVAIFFSFSFRGVARLDLRKKLPRWIAPLSGALCAGVIASIFPQITGPKYTFLENAMDGSLFGAEHAWMTWAILLALLIAAKCLATAFMFGSGNAGGIFGPTLFIGGLAGAVVGALLEAIFPGTFPEPLRRSLIPVGMAGVLAASFRVPLAAIVMITEMTGSYGLIVPLMLVSILAYALGWRWGINAEQVSGTTDSPAHAGESLVSLLQKIQVQEVYERNWPFVIPPSATLQQMVSAMPPGSRPTFIVVDQNRPIGTISTQDVARLAIEGNAASIFVAVDMMNPNPIAARPTDSLYSTLELFARNGLDALIVVDPEKDNFLGVLPRSAVHKALQGGIIEERNQLLREHASIVAIDQDRQLESLLSRLPEQYRGTIQRMAVPEDVIGKSLRESDFRRRYGWEVIAIQSALGNLQVPPDPTKPLLKDDLLIVLLS